MPRALNPSGTDHFVYVIHGNDYPFYVGHGHLGRLEDRPRYVDRLVRLHPDRSYYKWTPHGIAIAALWAAGVEVLFDQISANQTKAEASSQEAGLIQQLIAEGFFLTNDVGNPGGREPEEVVAAVLRREKHWPFLVGLTPVNRYLRPARRPEAAA